MNSLYGRFAALLMDPVQVKQIILDWSKPGYEDMFNGLEKDNVITDIETFADGKELISYKKREDNNSSLFNTDELYLLNKYNPKDELLADFVSEVNNAVTDSSEFKIRDRIEVNVAVAAFITSYARVYMSKFKNNPMFDLYYTDTDSIIINKPLDELSKRLVGPEWGQLKLEHTIVEDLFLAPKMYGFKNESGESKTVIKGVKGNVPLPLLESLLIKNNSLELPNEK